MAEGDTITTGELGRKVDALQEAVREVKLAVDQRPAWRDVQRVEDGLVYRLAKLESWHTWAGRIIGGGLLTAALALLVRT